jgi:outer membrane lipoprotein SlyB
MKPWLYVAAFALVFLGLVAPASAKGCIKGAVVGGAAGHYAGHHGVIGAVAGCIVGRHQAHMHARNCDRSAVVDSNR